MDIASFLKNTQISAPTVTKKKRTSERAELIGYFIERLNTRQKELGNRPYTPAFIGMKLAHLSVFDLYYLKRICEDSKDWYKTFWGSLKPVDKRID